MGLLRTILIILLVYYGVKIIMRLAAPYFMGYMSKKMQDKYGSQSPFNQGPKEENHKVGETVIDKVPKKERNSDDKVGEYIDYEEIEE